MTDAWEFFEVFEGVGDHAVVFVEDDVREFPDGFSFFWS